MDFTTFSQAAGGLALFLLAMLMMTEGLKTFGGGGLKRLLSQSTSTPLRGVGAGILVTAVVQSSSAVTVAAIGFVNAGLMNLRQALGVVFGTNIGTTMTAWLVSLVGIGFDIDAFALPIIAVGVALRLIVRNKRYQGLGEALTGFGLFFIGLGLLQQAFSGVAAGFEAEVLGGGFALHWAAALAVGFLVTTLTQSSSASIALILTAAAGGLLTLPTAAAAIIGANVGTTSTAVLAALNATAAARRLAMGHVGFNVITGCVALLILPLMLWTVDGLALFFGLVGNVAAKLALFHTVFNVMGVLLLLPFVGRLADWLETRFRSQQDELARPQHLDATLATSPELALGAVQAELQRLRAGVGAVAGAALTSERAVDKEAEAVRQLAATVTEYIAGLRAERMPRQVSDALTLCLRAARYLDEAGRMVASAQALAAASQTGPENVRALIAPVLAAAADCLAAPGAETARSLEAFEPTYQQGKGALLAAVVAQQLGAEAADTLLDDLSHLRRLVQQWVKADDMLNSPELAQGPQRAGGAKLNS